MLFKNLREDVDTVLAKDPAARSRLEVVLCYPGFHSILFYRAAHWLWVRQWLLLGRFVSHLGRLLTGIEIHPGATIGRRFFIHHGKRHPTLSDGVIVGSGAQILGGFTVGKDARVGANAVVLAEVPAGATVVGIPAKAVGAPKPVAAKSVSDFLPYGTPCDEIPDPVARVLNGLLDEVQLLRARLQEVEHQVEAERSAPVPLMPVPDEPALAQRRKA